MSIRVSEQASRSNRAAPANQRPDGERFRKRLNPIANLSDEPHAARNQRELQVEVRIRERFRRIADEQADAGEEVQPEAEPHGWKKPAHLSDGDARRDAKNPERNRGVDARRESHADGM